jgi:hypothetical protein
MANSPVARLLMVATGTSVELGSWVTVAVG